MSCFILFAKDSRKITLRQLEFSQKRTIGSTKNKTMTIFCSFSFFFSAGITITKNYLRKKYIDLGRDRAFLNLVSLVRSCVGSLAAVFQFLPHTFFRQIVMRRTRACQNASLWRLEREGRVTSLRRDNY